MKSLLALFFILLILSCKKEEKPESEIKGLAYYPLTSGKFIVYDIDSTVYTELPKDTISYKYRIKEKIADEFTDNQGKRAIRLERYIKKFNPLQSYDSLPWTIKEVWLINPDNTKILQQENNIVYTRLIFPVLQNATWNGNAFNNLGTQNYSYEYVDQKETIGASGFDQVLKVKQRTDTLNLIQYLLEYEQYALNIGLVNKVSKHLFSNSISAGIPVLKRIEYGYMYSQTFQTFGYE